jgi:hypothetical protein
VYSCARFSRSSSSVTDALIALPLYTNNSTAMRCILVYMGVAVQIASEKIKLEIRGQQKLHGISNPLTLHTNCFSPCTSGVSNRPYSPYSPYSAHSPR